MGYVLASAQPCTVTLLGQDLGRLPLGRRGSHGSLNGDGAAGAELLDFALVIGERGLGEDLHVALAGAVVDFEEAEALLGIAAGANPALKENFLADGVFLPCLGDGDFFHGGSKVRGQG